MMNLKNWYKIYFFKYKNKSAFLLNLNKINIKLLTEKKDSMNIFRRLIFNGK